MPTINTQDLTGPALDWAVAHAEGMTTPGRFVYVRGAMRRATLDTAERLRDMESIDGASIIYSPSTNPAQGHPIIEREGISTFFTDHTGDHAWFACVGYPAKLVRQYHGHTALIAALRCYVAARLGPTVDVPQELVINTPAPQSE